MFFYDEFALQEVTHGRYSCMMNNNFDFCPNYIMKIFQVTTIVSLVSLEFKMFGLP
jgi:hypothetical protein